MNGLSICAIILALLSSLVTWFDFIDSGVQATSQQHKYLNMDSSEEIDPEDVQSLRVAQWNEAEKQTHVFEVAFSDGDWRIPSHHNYPADGGDRVGNTAGQVLNLVRGPLVSSDPKLHKDFGVLDPLEEHEDSAGIGERVTVSGTGGKLLVDLIVGQSAEGSNVVYVRQADGDDVYTAEIKLDISTAFKDWVETDLLKIASPDIRMVQIEDYSIVDGRLELRAQTLFQRANASASWTSEQLPEGKQVKKETIDALVAEATSLKLVGVRPYHEAWLQERGFYFDENKTLYGDEGVMVLTAENGVVYFLYFGEIALGDTEDTSAELNKKQGVETATGDNRYMAVYVRYDQERDLGLKNLMQERDAAQEAREQQEESADEKPEQAQAESEDAEKVEVAEDTEEPERDFEKEIRERRESGAKQAEQLQARFGQYFYVIDDKSFKQLRPSKDEMFVDPPKAEKEKEQATETDPAKAPE